MLCSTLALARSTRVVLRVSHRPLCSFNHKSGAMGNNGAKLPCTVCCTTDTSANDVEPVRVQQQPYFSPGPGDESQIQHHTEEAERQVFAEETQEQVERQDAQAAVEAALEATEASAAKPETEKVAETAPATSCDFMITLRKQNSSETWGFGLRRLKIADKWIILGPEGRALEEWNVANPKKIVRMYDEIVSVNGFCDSDGILQAMKSDAKIEVALRRQLRVTAEVCNDGLLGMKLQPGTLKVMEISEGIISNYNKQCPFAETWRSPVSEGDKLVEINGKAIGASGDLNTELGKFTNGEYVNFTFSREAVE